MKCVVLAAGYATRLYPLTENFPKPLLEVNGKTILDWLLDDIDTIPEIDGYVIISNHKFVEHFENWAKNVSLKSPVTVIDDGSVSNDTRLGAVKDVAFAIDELKLDDDLLVIAGDNILDFSFTKFVNFYKEKNATCVMRYYEESKAKLQKCGVAEIDENSLITNMTEKPQEPQSNWAVPPFYIYKKCDLPFVDKGINSGCGIDAPGSFIAWLCGQTDVYAMEMPGDRYDIGDINSYEEVKQTYKGITK